MRKLPLVFLLLLLLLGCEAEKPRYEFRVESYSPGYIVCIEDSSGQRLHTCLSDKVYKTATEADAVAQQMNKAHEETKDGNHP